MTAATACRTCGAEPLANARFCHGCGSPVGESEPHAEYKQVTALFADVVRSMELAAALDMERFRDIVTDWWSGRRRWCATTVGAWSSPATG